MTDPPPKTKKQNTQRKRRLSPHQDRANRSRNPLPRRRVRPRVLSLNEWQGLGEVPGALLQHRHRPQDAAALTVQASDAARSFCRARSVGFPDDPYSKGYLPFPFFAGIRIFLENHQKAWGNGRLFKKERWLKRMDKESTPIIMCNEGMNLGLP